MIYNFYCFLLYFMIFSILYPSTLLLVPGKATGSHFSGEVDLLLYVSWDWMREGWSHWKHVGFHTVAFFISDPVEVGSATIIQDVAVGALQVGGTSTIGGTYSINNNAILGREVVIEVGAIFKGLTTEDGNGLFSLFE